METLRQDFQYAVRVLVKRPVYAVITIVVFALAIGANTTVFSIFNGFYLRPLPYPEGNRLVIVYNSYPNMGLDFAGTSIPDYLDRRERAKSLQDLAIFQVMPRTLGGEETPERILVTRASPSMFSVFKTAPQLGRGFTQDEARPGNEKVVVLSHRLWNTRYGASAGIVGRDIELDGERYRVAGVMPDSFRFPSSVMDAWIPYAFTPQQMSDTDRGQEHSISIGRLRPGATIEGLTAELDAIVRQNLESGRFSQREDFIKTTGFTGRAQSLRAWQVGDYRDMLVILQGIVLAVLLIACANVANLQLARMAARRKELATRTALGANQVRLARLVLAESFLLALLGAVAGLVLAYGGLELVRVLGIDHANQGYQFAMDPAVFGFTAAAAILAALVSALLPLVAMKRADLAQAVHESGRIGSGGRQAQGFRNMLTVVQIAVSVALLVGAGLLSKSFYQLQQAGTGFNTDNVWTARVAIPMTRYPDDQARARFFEQALDNLRALPGVIDAGYTSILPFSGNNSQGSYLVEDYTPPPGVSPPHAQQRVISEGFLPSLGIPVIKGRNFTATETEPVAIVDQNTADKYWPDGDVIGKRISGDYDGSNVNWSTVIGVVPAIKHDSLAEDPVEQKETVYWFFKQTPHAGGSFVLKTLMSEELITRAATDAINRIDPRITLSNVLSMNARVSDSLGPQRTPMVLTLVFAGIAFTLAVIGIYGVLTWTVTQRFGEFGVRMALGARKDDIVQLVLKQGGRLIIIGLAAGIAGAVALGRLLSSQIYHVSSIDPAVFTVAVAGLTASAFLASWLPARRASRIDPMQALREE